MLKEEVLIARKDGSKFKVIPIIEQKSESPFDVGGVDTNIKKIEPLAQKGFSHEWKTSE